MSYIPKPAKTVKKKRKPIPRLGKRGTQYKQDRKLSKFLFWMEKGAYCQSCPEDTEVPLEYADFSHKVPAGRKSKCNDLEHGVYSCRACHTWLEDGPMANDARKVLIASPISMLTGGKVDWPEPLRTSLEQWHKTNGWINGL